MRLTPERKRIQICLNFQYLYDDSQEVAKSYQAVCTPDIYGFNKDKILKYRGRIDSGVMLDKSNVIRVPQPDGIVAPVIENPSTIPELVLKLIVNPAASASPP